MKTQIRFCKVNVVLPDNLGREGERIARERNVTPQDLLNAEAEGRDHARYWFQEEAQVVFLDGRLGPSCPLKALRLWALRALELARRSDEANGRRNQTERVFALLRQKNPDACFVFLRDESDENGERLSLEREDSEPSAGDDDPADSWKKG